MRTSGSGEPGVIIIGDAEGLEELLYVTGSLPFIARKGEYWSSNDGGKDGGVGAEPPSSIDAKGIHSMVQFILLGPLVRRTLSS